MKPCATRAVITPKGGFASVRDAAAAHGITREAAYQRAQLRSYGWRYADQAGSMTPKRAHAAGAEARENGALVSDNPFISPELRSAWWRGWESGKVPNA